MIKMKALRTKWKDEKMTIQTQKKKKKIKNREALSQKDLTNPANMNDSAL